ncbi:hypothetical protein F5Y18DRAFT_393110 [Xylariaceae sp. FL1019]|nr:hypothetical protein F5Y18DRAFT_393110 [Xylariaceae sp. FL1019]
MQIKDVPTIIASALMLASGVQATYVLALFQDQECATPTDPPETSVWSGTCDSHTGGFSSFKVLHKWNSPKGTLNIYKAGQCVSWSGYPDETYFNPDLDKCHNMGWTANAVQLYG